MAAPVDHHRSHVVNESLAALAASGAATDSSRPAGSTSAVALGVRSSCSSLSRSLRDASGAQGLRLAVTDESESPPVANFKLPVQPGRARQNPSFDPSSFSSSHKKHRDTVNLKPPPRLFPAAISPGCQPDSGSEAFRLRAIEKLKFGADSESVC